MATDAKPLDASKVVIADLGKLSSKGIKGLKKGKGKGWKRLSDAVADVQADGNLGKDVLVVLVRQREGRKKSSSLSLFPPF